MVITILASNWILASLPIKEGGLGAQDPSVIQPFAAMASFLKAASSAQDLSLSISSIPRDLIAIIPVMARFAPTLTSYLRAAFGGDVNLDRALSHPLAEQWVLQESWMSEVHSTTIKAWSGEAADRPSRLRELFSAPHAGSWLTLKPDHEANRPFLSSNEWQRLLK